MDRRALLTVFLVGLISLAFELVQVRMLSFFLGNGMDFLAIPVALLGLAIGSMSCHFLYRGPLDVLVDRLSAAVGPLVGGVLLAVFAIANLVFPDVHTSQTDPWMAALRTCVYGLVFLPPYVAFGALLAAAFGRAGDRIGRLYFFDLAGAGLGCAIVPLMRTWTDLWPTLVLLLACCVGLFAVAPRSRAALAGAVAAWGVLAVLAAAGLAFRDHPNPELLARSVLRQYSDNGIVEVAVRWNQIARTALMKARPNGPYAIVQDNGVSNVILRPWDREATAEEALATAHHHALAWKLGRSPKSILVMFAGIGRDLMVLDTLAEGEATLTGVELNPDVVNYQHHPAAKRLGIEAYLAQPGRTLVNQEGRHFLDVDRGTYDLMYVANNGALSVNRTGHSRKFLDTCDAMGEYLDHLAPGGLMVFVVQPIDEKIPCFRKLFAERGLGDATDAMFVFGWPRNDVIDSLVVAPQGLSQADVATLRGIIGSWDTGEQILWDPLVRRGPPRIHHLMTADLDTLRLVTDDRPFTRPIVLSKLDLFPTEASLRDPEYVAAWLKLFTVAFFLVVCTGIASVAHLAGGAHRRVPLAWIGYLFASGIGYMCVEIGLIAKTELFVGNPLYAVALNLATFLVASACGAALQDRYRERTTPAVLAALAVGGVVWGLLAARACNTWLIGVPLPVKALALALAVFPPGMALGAFYPYCVARLVGEGRADAVPMSYGLTTLASVLGSSFAMTAIINLGFTRVIAIGVLGYVVASSIAFARGLRTVG
ncbi:MAG: hypothetical protein R3F59_21190 [Myxococcota bacterium]